MRRDPIRLGIAIILVTALVLGLLIVALWNADNADAGRGELRCRFQRLEAGTWTRTETRRTVACFARKFGVGESLALLIAERESGFYARAYNATGCGGSGCLGTYQHHAAYWPGRVADADDALRRWDVKKRKWTNPRVAAVVTMVMVRRSGGWGAWSTCC